MRFRPVICGEGARLSGNQAGQSGVRSSRTAGKFKYYLDNISEILYNYFEFFV